MDRLNFEREYLVHVYETGPDGRINLYSLFNYMQDIASDHAVKLGYGREDLLAANRFWVLSRMYAVISDMPKWNDTIIIRTWPDGTDRLFALRKFSIYYPDGSPVASASSSWLILDHATRKVQRPDAILPGYRSDQNSKDQPVRNAARLESGDGKIVSSSPIRIRPSDLDVNLHTNNVTYLKWVTDTYDPEFIMNHSPSAAEINYLAESLYNEEITIRTTNNLTDGYVFNHSVIRSVDNRELCRIKLEWKKSSVKKS